MSIIGGLNRRASTPAMFPDPWLGWSVLRKKHRLSRSTHANILKFMRVEEGIGSLAVSSLQS